VARHVDLLRTLAGLWGALAMLVGLSMLLLAGGAAAELRAPHAEVALAAGVAAGLFGLIGLFAVVWGAAHVWAAVLIQRRRPFGRMLMLGLALVDLIVLPFGTALGIYALWVLLANEGRRLFEPAPVS
jgi:hypothetical protein